MRNRIRPAQPVPTRTGERWAWSTDPSLAEVMAGYAAGATVADVAAARVALEKAPLEVEPLVTFRAAEAFEGLRLATEVFESKQGRPVRVFLWTAGDVAMRRARAMFVSDFFGVAGFAVADHPGYESVEDGLAAALDEQPDVVVLCSSDPEYAELATPICDALVAELPRAMRLLAGYPTEQLDALKAAGIEDFVHVKTDAAVFLAACQKRLGITS